jgi:uncharacterized repeat protein (TIGR03803 family)
MNLSSMQKLPVVICGLSALLASCSHAPVASLPAAANDLSTLRSGSPTARFAHLFSFNGTDGKEPYASFVYANGELYGTTYGGGKSDNGTVFEMTAATRKESVLHSFTGGMDGSLPEASLLDVQGTLYGTTVNGGGSGDEGTVFKVDSNGTETILHRFGIGSDGANPYAGLTDLGGTFYGTTAGGGADSQGTVFKITTSGSESVLYSFGKTLDGGTTPVGRLIDVNGMLYGTTMYGGSSYRGKYCYGSGCGTVFKITSSGVLTVLYNFQGGSDGSMPAAQLTNVNGTLYGTTLQGGGTNDGTVFEITPSQKERVLHGFKGGTDGAAPLELIDAKGTLYGTTSAGGAGNAGTVFAITLGGSESTIHTFTGGPNGAAPHAGLIDVNGILYGTTSRGGASRVGTVYTIAP